MKNSDSLMLGRAAHLLGGLGLLRDYLKVPIDQLVRWLDGKEPVPAVIQTKAIEIVMRGAPTEEVESNWPRGPDAGG